MTKYGGDPTTYQLRDMNRRITSLEKAGLRQDARIRNLQAKVATLEANDLVSRAIALRLEERIS